MNDPSRQVWILTEKSGEILCAYCTCTAGLCRCCNHVIAALYKVEHAVSHGLTQSSCTSIPCQWNKPTESVSTPMAIKDIIFEKHLKMNPNPRKSVKRRLYDPRPVSKRTVTDESKQNLLKELKEVSPEAGIHQSFRPLPQDDLPPPLDIIGMTVRETNPKATDKELLLSFFDSISFNDSQLAEIEKATRSQSQSFQWKSQRRGRITSSRFHEIYTKVNSLNVAKGAIKPKTTPLLADLLNPSRLDHIDAIKYGKEHEDDARQAFASIEVSKHVNGKLALSGLVVSKSHPFLGASPDNVLTCKCCGKMAVEYKCPYLLKKKELSVRDGHAFLDFLVDHEDK